MRTDFIKDIGALFDVEVKIIKMYNSQWNDWINHSENIIPPNGSKIKLIYEEPIP